jgi:flagellar hook capping protein FlgD
VLILEPFLLTKQKLSNMKKVFTLALIAGISMLAGSMAKANTICFTDAFGYRWNITYSSDGNGHYAGSGTVDLGGGLIWNAYAASQLANLSGPVELHAINPNPDGCVSYSDSFVYVGTCQVFRSGGQTTGYTGSGEWTSYCFGGALNSGTWDVSGPCGTGKSISVDPKGPASHVLNSSTAHKSSNTVCFTDAFGEVWIITYSPNGNGGYWGTGTVDIGGGVLWNVDASGEFSNLTGDVELHAHNPNPDGCNTYSDSFTYVGSAQVFRSGGQTTGWSGSGTWMSYCFGGVLNVGTWDASGPCGMGKATRVDPNGPATHGTIISLVVSPNPATNHTAITFKLSKQSQVNVTVYNYLQQPVKVLANGSQAAGKQNYNWDLRDAKGNAVSNGLYRVVAVINGKSYSSNVQVIR